MLKKMQDCRNFRRLLTLLTCACYLGITMPVVPFINATNARELGLAGAHARWHTPKPEPIHETTSQPQAMPVPVPDKFLQERLREIRDLARMTDKRLRAVLEAAEVDDAAVDKLTRSSAALYGLEQRLAGRPNLAPVKSDAQAAHRGPSLADIERMSGGD